MATTINVRLCGGIPRSDFQGAPRRCTSEPTHQLCDGHDHIVPQSNQTMKSLDIPQWAVPAQGETRLEPVCEGIGRQTAVDLTTQASFVVGRSPACDVQLMHATSSRRHAMIFHHSNGACYIVDCGSAHGTYINGVRVPPPTEGGVVVPQKVRRGAMIRFGGPGAPCFILKSFSFALGDIAACGEAVRRNTRWNALGSTARTFITLDRKRSFDSLSSAETIDISERYFEPQTKRMRCESPPMTEEAPLRMVTPPVSSPRKRVVFSDEQPQCFYAPCVTPEESSAAA